ncbi:MAG: AAA family ATPase [bacterium]|nr:AAA family ATPase [bacterium]
MRAPDTDLLKRFIESFHKGIAAEMDAMRQRLGPFEAPVRNGRAAGMDRSEGHESTLYDFDLAAPNDKLLPGIECTLAFQGGEYLVSVVSVDRTGVRIACPHTIPLGDRSYTLVIYPWFLYERLRRALESLLERDVTTLANAFAVFGKAAARIAATGLVVPHAELNDSQRRAVQLCCDRSLAFVWGPPGTGKTTTLGHIVTELLAHGHRVLITSTTNAAVDQALAKLLSLDAAQPYHEDGRIVRVGQAQAPTLGAGLDEVARRLNDRAHRQLERWRTRVVEARTQRGQCERILDKLETEAQPFQDDLFAQARPNTLAEWDLTPVFSATRTAGILAMDPNMRVRAVERRRRDLERVVALAADRIEGISGELRGNERTIVRKAKVVLATMTNVYVNRLIEGDRFDVVIVEEAGMAVLPALFYCATLADDKTLIVGDPRQLPPIVQSNERVVHNAMGRSIFEVTVPQPHASDAVVMLDTQYRMHPRIGDLVSELYYDGKLVHGACTSDRTAIAARSPHPGAPIVVVDTQGRTTCEVREGAYSRYNDTTAEFCVGLARKALRSGIETVAIITPYVEQSRRIRQRLATARLGDRVESHTVHRFQGNERDLVILDTVDAAPMKPGVLLTGAGKRGGAENLLNVSISRSRGKLIVVADVAYFAGQAACSAIDRLLRQAAKAGKAVALS